MLEDSTVCKMISRFCCLPTLRISSIYAECSYCMTVFAVLLRTIVHGLAASLRVITMPLVPV